ncbi:UDP-glucuronosyltransferase 1-1, partial [Massospora cicadina]
HINVNGTQLPLSDLQHIKILTWANQLPILNHPHTKLIITHAGLESTMEAIVSQTPALAFPLVFDQPKNAKRIVQLGIGRAIKISSIKQVIADNIKQILTTDKIKINLAKIHAVATSDTNSLDSAANFILAYTNLATRCRRIMKFNPKDNLPPCELAHLIPAPEFKYRPELKMIFAASTAILLYLLTMRLLAAYVKVGKHKKME